MNRIKQWLKKTPLYPLFRAGWNAIRRKTRTEQIERRDAQELARILRRVFRDGGNGVDVGAHRGDVLAEFVRLSPKGRHIAIEPIPELAERLRVAFPQVQVHAAAVSDTSGTAEFQWVASNPAFSGLKRRWDLGAQEQVQPVSVSVVRLDDVVPAGHRISLLKIDVEGAELGVLRGASRMLAADRPIVVFEHGSASSTYATTSADIYDEFAQHRMAVWLMSDWLTGRFPLTRDTFAAVSASGEYWNFLAAPAPDGVAGRGTQIVGTKRHT